VTDIISRIIDQFIERAAVTQDLAREIEKQIRKQYGGEMAYITKRCALVESKKQIINNALCAGRSVQQIEQQLDIPRRTIYRLINQKGN
jgi:Mor family transcriptional regulator